MVFSNMCFQHAQGCLMIDASVRNILRSNISRIIQGQPTINFNAKSLPWKLRDRSRPPHNKCQTQEPDFWDCPKQFNHGHQYLEYIPENQEQASHWINIAVEIMKWTCSLLLSTPILLSTKTHILTLLHTTSCQNEPCPPQAFWLYPCPPWPGPLTSSLHSSLLDYPYLQSCFLSLPSLDFSLCMASGSLPGDEAFTTETTSNVWRSTHRPTHTKNPPSNLRTQPPHLPPLQKVSAHIHHQQQVKKTWRYPWRHCLNHYQQNPVVRHWTRLWRRKLVDWFLGQMSFHLEVET